MTVCPMPAPRSIRSRRCSRSRVAVGLALAVLAGCASGGEVDNPLVRKATWYSFLNGDDLTAACVADRPGSPVPRHLRLVFNGVYAEEVRIYDLREEGGQTRLALRRLTPAPLTLSLGGSAAGAAGAVFDPWRGETVVVPVTETEAEDLLAVVIADGLTSDPPPRGLTLDSRDFYWVVSGCLGGKRVFNAWRRGTPRHAALTFDDRLAAWPGLARPLPVWREAEPDSFETRRREQFRFLLRVEPGGLRDTGPLARRGVAPRPGAAAPSPGPNTAGPAGARAIGGERTS